MEQRDKRHNACGKTADFLEADGYIENHQNARESYRRKTLEQEAEAHGSVNRVRLKCDEVIVGILSLKILLEVLLNIGLD